MQVRRKRDSSATRSIQRSRLQLLLACNLHCVRNTTDRHRTIAELILARRKEQGVAAPADLDFDVFAEDTCIEGCLKKPEKEQVALRWPTWGDLPEPITAYLSCASSCRGVRA